MRYSREGISLAVRIEDDQCDCSIIQVQLVDETVAGLTRQIPQQRLTHLFTSITEFRLVILQGPDIATMR